MEADGDDETSREQLLAALNDRLDQFLSGDNAVLGQADAFTVADALGAVPGNLETAYALGLFHHYRLTAGLAGQERDDAARALGYFAAVFRQAPDLVPEGVRELVGGTWKPDADDVSTWRLRAQHLLQDPRRFRLPDLFSDAIYLLQLTLGTGMLSPQAQAASMTSLVIAYAGRFEATGDPTALDGAADAAAQCVEVTEPADPNLPGRRSNLAAALATRFDHTGAMEDLEQAIAQLWIAVDAAAPDEWADYLANLGGALLLRYQHSGDTASLNQAVECARQAVSSIDTGRRQRPRMLGTLALALRTRFQRRGDRSDIDAAVDAIEEAVQATEPGHPDEAGHLSALSTTLRVRSGVSRAASDLDRAVRAARAAAHAAQSDSDVRVKSLSNLGAALSARFSMSGVPADLDDAITAQAEAAELASLDNPVRATILANLGLSLRHRARHSQNRGDDLRSAARAYASSGAVDGAPALVRATSSYDAGVILGELEDWPAAVEQFQRSVGYLSAVIDHRLDRDDRQHHLSRMSGLGSEAAAAALRAGITPAASLGLMERGRGVLLAQAVATRSGLADLRTRHPAVADRFDKLTRALELMSDDTIDRGGGRLRHRREQERDRLLREIRELPGSEQFLLPVKDPLSLSLPGPAVVINVARPGCDAFIIVGGDVTCVPLPAVTYQEAREQANALLRAVNGDGWNGNDRLRAVLGWAWDTIMEPIFHHLGMHAVLPKPGLRVWWIPTGPLTVLPLHAAGRPDSPGNSVLEQVVSSYAPTVRSLAHAFLDQSTFAGKGGQRALVVAVPSTAGHSGLPETAAEADEVAGSLNAAGRGQVDVLTGADASRTKVTAGLCQSTWVHLACHAATSGNPADSHLVLHDGDLTVREIAELHIDHADLAYLSACTTAFGGTDLVDEAIHITSAFQLAGFRHVIGTLWKVEDAAARTMARETYALLANSTPAADAIHEAVRRLRERYPRNPRIWAAYLHVGL